ncbi:MAG: hypothetical protein JJU11_02715 [Candidatus Sumerlaeia bacterium]|nr:hypothetical protein [Candidatus Sumerlaeia bacterium]
MPNRIFHFAARRDLAEVIQVVESNHSLKYVVYGMSDHPEYDVYNSLLDYPMLGTAEGDQYVACTIMNIFPREAEIKLRTVPQRRGGVKYLIDPMENPCSMIIRLGGVYEEGVLIHGETATTYSTDDLGTKLFHAFARQIRKRFRKVHEFWVGKEAEELYRKGWRLTQSKHRSTDYDLKFPE